MTDRGVISELLDYVEALSGVDGQPPAIVATEVPQ